MCPKALHSKSKLPKGEKTAASVFTKTRREHSMEIAEDYVEAIAEQIERAGEARVVELAKQLGVTHVTVTRTISRLQKAGYVQASPYRAIFLTEKGKKLAKACKARHEIVVAFLKSLGVSDRVAKMDAEGLEHHVSAETLKAFQKAMRGA